MKLIIWREIILRLTLTWDVFKFVYLLDLNNYLLRLTLTWDVFKLVLRIYEVEEIAD